MITPVIYSWCYFYLFNFFSFWFWHWTCLGKHFFFFWYIPTPTATLSHDSIQRNCTFRSFVHVIRDKLTSASMFQYYISVLCRLWYDIWAQGRRVLTWYCDRDRLMIHPHVYTSTLSHWLQSSSRSLPFRRHAMTFYVDYNIIATKSAISTWTITAKQ